MLKLLGLVFIIAAICLVSTNTVLFSFAAIGLSFSISLTLKLIIGIVGALLIIFG